MTDTMSVLKEIAVGGGWVTIAVDPAAGGRYSVEVGSYLSAPGSDLSTPYWQQEVPASTPDDIPLAFEKAHALWAEHVAEMRRLGDEGGAGTARLVRQSSKRLSMP